MASFKVRITKGAEDDFRAVPFPFRRQINRRIFRLKENPFPPDCRRQPELGYTTLQAYGWEIVYEVDEGKRMIVIFRIYR